jgi:hypothetical protein
MMLVERLRAIDKEIPWHARDEAAELILSLSQERDRLREQVKALEHAKNDLLAENSQFDDLRAEIVSIRERMAENMAAIGAMTVENVLLANERDRLREALAPFAKDGDRFPYDSILVTSFGDPTAVTTGDLRRARAALNKEPPCET